MPDRLFAYSQLAIAASAPIERDVLLVSGPEAGLYLQGQLSQDVEELAVGTTVWSWVLQPAGKVDALVRVTRTAAADWAIDVDGGFGDGLLTRLTRFKLRTKADIEPLDWSVLALRGASLPPVEAPAGGLVADASWPGLAGVDLLGPAGGGLAVPAGVEVVPAEVLEVARIEAGIPKMGAELTEATIPAETGIVERTVSFTKGCYTGQELVARIDSRGSNVPRRLRAVALDGPAEVGSALVGAGGAGETGEKQVGTLTSVAESPAFGWIGLAYVARGVAAGESVNLEGGGGGVVRELPLR